MESHDGRAETDSIVSVRFNLRETDALAEK